MRKMIATAKMIFKNSNINEILKVFNDKTKTGYEFKYEDFRYIANRYMRELTNDELFNLYCSIQTQIADEKELFGAAASDVASDGINPFDFLTVLANALIEERYSEPVCRYENILIWRQASIELEEDLYVTAFFANKDSLEARRERNFCWKPVISHNNSVLKTVINKGIAENHFHLTGSAQFFQLSWINIMNQITSGKVKQLLDELGENRLNEEYLYRNEPNDTLYLRCFKAAHIRLYLYYRMNDDIYEHPIREGAYDKKDYKCKYYDLNWLIAILQSKNIYDLFSCFDIDNITEAIRMVNRGCEYDYAMTLSKDIDDVNEYYAGERALMYHVLRQIYSRMDDSKTIAMLFHVYILLKESIRSEFIQTNEVIGFDNFRLYQDRKLRFISGTPTEKVFYRTAIKDTLRNQPMIKSLEVRFTPSDSAESMCRYIRLIDNYVGMTESERNSKYFFVLHFIKQKDNKRCIESSDLCRHNDLRAKVRKQTCAIMKLRECYPEVAYRIKAIDAANNEIGCRPEVFAQAIRTLTEHEAPTSMIKSTRIPKLKVTYHVGEDYVDIADGLRAIDEALNFFNLRCGDRLGHAIVLGDNIREWYRLKNDTIMISQQDYLDNIVWMYSKVIEYRLTTDNAVMFYLQSEFQRYFRIVYGDNMGSFGRELTFGEFDGNVVNTINTYYDAWKLRGDNPERYRYGTYDAGVADSIGNWSHINPYFPKDAKDKFTRNSPSVAYLYYTYHYNSAVKKAGDKRIKIKIPHMIIRTLELIQDKMQRLIAYKGICIEANPSSNCFIGSFGKYEYEKHPMLKFYTIGLDTSDGTAQKSNNISVCINTDDQSVFKTSLENEYAYMARALECAKNDDGTDKYGRNSIYIWLDNVRQIGLDFSFDNEV